MDSGVASLDNNISLEEEEEIKIFVSQMLASRVFLADYQERRYVEHLNDYRDVIVLDKQHGDLKRDLDVVKRRLDGYYKGKIWIGITGPQVIGAPSGHCLWVNLQDQPLGQYWFIINKVKFLPREVILKLKKIRMTNASQPASEPSVDNEYNISELISSLTINNIKSSLNTTVSHCAKLLLSILTYQNMKQTVLFLSVLLLTVISCLLNCLRYLGDYSIRFLRELNGLIHAITPFMLGVLDLIYKVIGGAYFLLAMMWLGKSKSSVAPPNLMLMKQQFDRNQIHEQKCLPPASLQNQTYADFRQKYQNSGRFRPSAYGYN